MGLSEPTFRRLLIETNALVLRSGSSAWYVGVGQAEAAVRWLHAEGFRVVGLEGFTCDGTSVHPVGECIADLSGVDSAAAADVACRILSEWADIVGWIDISPVLVEELE